MCAWNHVQCEQGSSFFVFIPTLWFWSLIFRVLKLHNTQKKQAFFVHALNLDSCNLHVNFLETQKIKLIVLYQLNQLAFCTRINLFGNFVRVSCGELVVFLFVELQLIRVVTRGHFLVYSLSLKSHLEIFVISWLFLFKIP